MYDQSFVCKSCNRDSDGRNNMLVMFTTANASIMKDCHHVCCEFSVDFVWFPVRDNFIYKNSFYRTK